MFLGLFEICVPFLSFSLYLVFVSFLLSQFCHYAYSVSVFVVFPVLFWYSLSHVLCAQFWFHCFVVSNLFQLCSPAVSTLLTICLCIYCVSSLLYLARTSAHIPSCFSQVLWVWFPVFSQSSFLLMSVLVPFCILFDLDKYILVFADFILVLGYKK